MVKAGDAFVVVTLRAVADSLFRTASERLHGVVHRRRRERLAPRRRAHARRESRGRRHRRPQPVQAVQEHRRRQRTITTTGSCTDGGSLAEYDWKTISISGPR